MGKLYDDSIFNRRDEAAKQQAQTGNRLFILVIILAAAAIIGIAAWRWFHDPAKMIINVNTATIEELQYLPEVGPAIAKEIVAHRPYASPEELLKVKGIGPKTFEKMKPRVKVE
jgi:competence ComEA-like helix-hairpin-helix protein